MTRHRFGLRGARASRINRVEAMGLIATENSYSRLPFIISLHGRMSPKEWLVLLGEYWSVCDNIGEHIAVLQRLIPQGNVPAMMKRTERWKLRELPEVVPIFRGADHGVNDVGLSWSLNRVVAARFPFLNRYKARRPVLHSGLVERDRITAIKLGRTEDEVIVAQTGAIVLTGFTPLTEGGVACE